MNRLVSLWTGPLPAQADISDAVDWIEPPAMPKLKKIHLPPAPLKKREMEAAEFSTIRRENCKLSQYQLATVLGYAANPSINRFDSGDRAVPSALAKLMRLFKQHGVPPEFWDHKWRHDRSMAVIGQYHALDKRLEFMRERFCK